MKDIVMYEIVYMINFLPFFSLRDPLHGIPKDDAGPEGNDLLQDLLNGANCFKKNKIKY